MVELCVYKLQNRQSVRIMFSNFFRQRLTKQKPRRADLTFQHGVRYGSHKEQEPALCLVVLSLFIIIYMFGLVGQKEVCGFQGVGKPKINKIKRRKFGEKGDSESESYEPDLYQIKKYGLPNREKKMSSGTWDINENRLYLRFMQENMNDLESEKTRRRTKVFYRLSKILKRRTPDQCRSHHQKLQIKYNDDLSLIMSAVQLKISQQSTNELASQPQGTTQGFLGKQTVATLDWIEDEDSWLCVLVDFSEMAGW